MMELSLTLQILDILRLKLQILTPIQPCKVARVMLGAEVGGCRPVVVVFSNFSEVSLTSDVLSINICPISLLSRHDGSL